MVTLSNDAQVRVSLRRADVTAIDLRSATPAWMARIAARGYFVGNHLEYRIGAFQGIRDAGSDDAVQLQMFLFLDRWNTLLIAEILHVDVGAQSGVVGQVPSVVIGIVVDHDLIGVPEPIVTEGDVVWRHTEEESVEPESSRTAACEPKAMTAPDAAGETTMLERMIDMIVAVATTRVMSNPVTVPVHVRRIGMSGSVAE
jgi:hypothetical protein